MDYMSIFNGILSTDGTFLDIYLNGLDEHKKFGSQNNDEAGLLQHITSLLTTSTTRIVGLRLLDKFLDNCSIEALDKKGHLWTTLVLKACNYQEFEQNAHIIFQVLNKLIKNSQKSPDLSKSFVSVHISKIYENATNVPLTLTKYALECIETCLRVYPGSSGPSRGVIERFLWKNIDHIDCEVVQNCGKCLHLLQQVKGGGIQGINHKTQWKNYQLQLLGGIHQVYNCMFANCVEIYDEKIEQEKLPWEAALADFDAEPVKKAAQMYIRCRNLIAYLSIALGEPFPVQKPILIKKILNIVVRGLGVNCQMLERNPIADNIALSILLPNLHEDLLNLLSVAIIILRGHILPYTELILGLTVDTLKWTSAQSANGGERNLFSLRTKVYESVTLWCKMFNSGNLCETIAEHLFQEILSDITPTQHEFSLRVLPGARKHMSKKARKQLHSVVQNEKPNSSKTQSDTGNEKQQELCIAALQCLQEIIFTVGNLLKPTILKKMQTSITKMSALFYEITPKLSHLYSNINCRIEIYNTLYSILMATHYLCPPPTELVLAIVQTAFTRDESLKVRTHCGLILKNIEKLVHPQKESLLFTIESRDIRNTFIKLGQENLLQDFEFNGLNTLAKANDHAVDDYIVLEVSSSENSALEPENEMQANNIPAVPENEEIVRNNKLDAQKDVCDNTLILESGKEIQTSSSDDVIESASVTIQVSENEETILNLNPPTNIDNQPKSPDIILTIEDQTNETLVKETEVDLTNYTTDEPKTKKPKLDDETEKTDASNSIINMEQDEDAMLADIASQFVDELE